MAGSMESPIKAPNENLKPATTDWFGMILIPACIPIILLQVISRRFVSWSKNDISFLTDFACTSVRFLSSRPYIIPISLLRHFSSDTSRVLTSPRFRNKVSAGNIYQPVLLPEVAGYWLCKGPPGSPVHPSKCDIVLYYLHGGAYAEGHAARFLALVLRVAEMAAERGFTLSCFGLRYSYAPEEKYPKQLEQAIEGYKYLTHGEGISPEKIGVMGDSAGGHLALCLLHSLHGLGLPIPERGAFLISPWLDLRCSVRPSVVRNRYKDFIGRDRLAILGENLFSSAHELQQCPHRDFTEPLVGDLKWKEILPKRVWMSAGANEILLDEIVQFKGLLEKDGVDVELDIKQGGIHVWQGMEDVKDSATYLKVEAGEKLSEGLLKGCTNIGEAVLKCVQK